MDTCGTVPASQRREADPSRALERRREPVWFEVAGSRLHGMLDLPRASCTASDIGVLMLNSDDGCRLGPHNLWVRLAGRLTEAGYPCLRFDYRGCGDSEGPEGSPPGVVGLTDAIAAERVLRSRTGVRGVVLIGICYGAEIALLASRCLPTVVGVAACSTGRYVTGAGYGAAVGHAAQYTRGYLRKLRSADTWHRLLAGRIHLGFILEGLLQRLSWTCWQCDRSGAAAAEKLAGHSRRRVRELFIYGGGDPLVRRYMAGYADEARRDGIDRRFRVIPGADHNYSAMVWSGEVIEAAAELVRVIEASCGLGGRGDGDG